MPGRFTRSDLRISAFLLSGNLCSWWDDRFHRTIDSSHMVSSAALVISILTILLLIALLQHLPGASIDDHPVHGWVWSSHVARRFASTLHAKHGGEAVARTYPRCSRNLTCRGSPALSHELKNKRSHHVAVSINSMRNRHK